MPESPKPLTHLDAEKKDDEVLARESHAYFVATPSLQLTAELLTQLRSMNLLWWSPEKLRLFVPTPERMRWLGQRPDLRQKVTSTLTGLAPKAARKKSAEFQANLIDSVIDDGDTTVRAFEDAFEPKDLAIYGPARMFWHHFRQQTPWDQKSATLQELMAWVLNALLVDKSSLDGIARKPILTAWQVRTSIEGTIWHTCMPLEIRIAIDDARFAREHADSSQPFHAVDDLTIALPHLIATHIAPKDLVGIFDAAEHMMGFAEAIREEDKAPNAAVAARSVAHPDAKRAEKVEPKVADPTESNGIEKHKEKVEVKSPSVADARPSSPLLAATPDSGKHMVASVVGDQEVAVPGSHLSGHSLPLSAKSANENPRASATNEVPVKSHDATRLNADTLSKIKAAPSTLIAKGKPVEEGAAPVGKGPLSDVMPPGMPLNENGKQENVPEKTGKGIMLGAALGLADENDDLQAFIDMVDGGDEVDVSEEETFPRLELPPQIRNIR